MEKMHKIAQDMFELGEKFSQMAKEATSPKQAKAAFDLAQKAYSLCVQAEKGKPRVLGISKNMNELFICSFTKRVVRSSFWVYYQEFCEQHNVVGLSKSQLFDLTKELGYQIRKSHGEYKIFPPHLDEVKPKVLESRKKLKQLGSDFLTYQVLDGTQPLESRRSGDEKPAEE